MKRKPNTALTCFKSIPASRLVKELAQIPPLQKIAVMVNGRPYKINRDKILRTKDGNFLIAEEI